MYRIKVNYTDDIIEEGLLEKYDEESVQYFIESNLPYNLISNFYNNELNVTHTIKKVQLSIYYIQTWVTGYDTYDGAVVVHYGEEEAKELLYNNTNKEYFLSAAATCIGKADKSIKEPEIILKSFNAG